MVDEMFGEFMLMLGLDVLMNNYWRFKFILSMDMRERESFEDTVKLTLSMFKDDSEWNLVNMEETMHLSEPLFQCHEGSK